jgi:hypothetical protein
VLLGCCAFMWTLWKTRNDATFRDKKPTGPTGIIYNLCSWLDKWSIFQTETQKEKVAQGSSLRRKIASEAFTRANGWAPTVRKLGWLLMIFVEL